MSNAELNAYRATSILATVNNLESKALLLEKEIGLDNFYALLSMGKTIGELANSIGVTLFDMEYILKRTPEHLKKFMTAKLTNVGSKSLIPLDRMSNKDWLEKEENNAASHHRSMAELALKSVSNINETDKGNGIVVNNTIVVGGRDVPDLPDGLAEVIDADVIDDEEI